MKQNILKLGMFLTIGIYFCVCPAIAEDKTGKITPSHVISLWLNINKTLPLLPTDASLTARLDEMKPYRFSGKVPADVLAQVRTFRVKLDQLRKRYELGPTKIFTGSFGNEITPAIVFINSGHVLDAVMELLRKMNPENQSYRENYHRHFLSGKTPSDVFGQVNLATRKLEQLSQSIE